MPSRHFALGLLALAALLTSALAAPAAFAQQAPEGLTVVGQGSSSAAPDVAFLNLGVQTSGSTAQQALNDNAAAMQRVIDALKGAGIAEADIQTVGLSVYPQTAPSDVESGVQEIVGYQALNSVSVTLRDPARAGEVFDLGIAAGANSSGGISFGLLDDAAVRQAALEAAVRDAQAKAQYLAASLGREVGAVIAVSEESFGGPIPLASADRAANGGTPVQQGQISYTANVRITFELR